MVVCKCRKATKLYCFVHKLPVCGECICFEEHKICVVRTYSEWVIDGEYDWPPKCCGCGSILEPGKDSCATRLGCLHVIHTDCFISHLKDFPHQTPSAGYVCPACSTPIWPPASIKDSSSLLHSKLKEAILQSGLEKNLFGNHPVSLPSSDLRGPPAFASEPLIDVTAGSKEQGPDLSSGAMRNETGPSVTSGKLASVAVGNSFSESNFVNNSNNNGIGSTTRKHVDRQNSDISYFVDDEDGNRKKYTRRGPFRHKFLRALLPFWSTALPTLPVTAPPRKDASHSDDGIEIRLRNQRLSRTDPRKILLFVAIMACMATMAILYYRLAQRDIGDEFPDDELQ